jgi:hypothetical protein
MKNLIFTIGLILVFSCTKTDKVTTTPPVSIQEEAIKFNTNLDTGTYNVADTLPLVITISSKIPTSGIIYSVAVNWTDSSKQIYKLDSISTASSLNLKIVGLTKTGNYSISISVTSKSTSTNTSNKIIGIVNNPLGRFMGYKVASNAKQLGTEYWTNTGVMGDLIIATFQKGVNRNNFGTFFDGFAYGDMNNDGYVDVFNPGQFYIQTQAKFSFLIWNQSTKTFENKNLFNNKSFTEFGRNKGKTIPYYLNNDNYVDFIISDMGDEGTTNTSDIEPIRIVLSDGIGGYDLKEIETNEKDSVMMVDRKISFAESKEDIAVGDLNGDNLPDLAMISGNGFYIYWGINSFPYFTQEKHATFVYDYLNFGKLADNGFGESAPNCAGGNRVLIADIDKDGKNDILMCGEDRNSQPFAKQFRVLKNLGNGKFNNSSVIKLPYYEEGTSNGVEDAVVEDYNKDGLNDIICVNHNSNYRNWSFFIYIQKPDGTFYVDKSMFQYNINTNRVDDFNWKPELIYFDYNGDGIKDLSYRNSADNPGFMQKKTVFIRQGNQFVEQDFFQFDPYANSIKGLVK